MKSLLFLLLTSFAFLASLGQRSKDEDFVKKVINAFQDDFNDGRFKMLLPIQPQTGNTLIREAELPKDVMTF